MNCTSYDIAALHRAARRERALAIHRLVANLFKGISRAARAHFASQGKTGRAAA